MTSITAETIRPGRSALSAIETITIIKGSARNITPGLIMPESGYVVDQSI
jgi:hypothetical protein